MKKISKIINCFKNFKLYKAYLRGVSPLFELSPLLKKINNAKTLIDIGSNKGQFILITNIFFPNVDVHSFEPQTDELNLQKKILNLKNIKYYNFALGNCEKTSNLYITKRKDSSSLLKPEISGSTTYQIQKVKKIIVKKLDNIKQLQGIKRPVILKLDVQGFELEVLKGSLETLNLVDHIITEVSFAKVYKDQVMKDEIFDFLHSKSFYLNMKCNLSKINGKPFQQDVLFSKKISNK